VAMVVTLRKADGRAVTLVDPSGGTFGAAGDFDRFIGRGTADVLGTLDPYADTALGASDMARLLASIDEIMGDASAGPELRGLTRLRVLAEACKDDPALALHFSGD
jgi:hypothetical protein